MRFTPEMKIHELLQKLFELGIELQDIDNIIDIVEERIRSATTTSRGVVKIGDGFKITLDGLLSVDPDSFSSDLITDFMKQLRLPLWLAKTTNFYVRVDGSDDNDGSANTPDKAFRTVQKAINYVSENYNLGTYNAVINVASGVYTGFTLPKYNTSTGRIVVTGAGESTILEATDTTIVSSTQAAGVFTLQNMRFNLHLSRTDITAFPSAILSTSGVTVEINNVYIYAYEGEETTSWIRALSTNGGSITIGANVNLTIDGRASGSRATAIYAESGGVYRHTGNGTVTTVNGQGLRCLTLGAQSLFGRNVAYSPPPLFAGNFTGQRAHLSGLSLVVTNGIGETYFPGTTAASVLNGSLIT